MTPEEAGITIYHNDNCTTSRNTLALIRNTGVVPHVIRYIETPPGRERLVTLVAELGIRPRDLLRRNGTPYDELQLDDPKWTDDELIDHMVRHPILMERPIVVTPLGTKVCRPCEDVLDILPGTHQGPFAKENGEAVIDAQGQRVPSAA